MSIATCPHCRSRSMVPDDALGKQARCPSCKAVYAISAFDSPSEKDAEIDQPQPAEVSTLTYVRASVWAFSFLVMLIVAIVFVLSKARMPAIQQTALAGEAVVWMILTYALARGLDSLLRRGN